MKKPIKILFADSDGACFNCVRLQKEWMGKQTGTEEEKHEKFRKEFCDYTELVFPEMAARVTRIVEETDCKIIWSSTCVYYPSTQTRMMPKGCSIAEVFQVRH